MYIYIYIYIFFFFMSDRMLIEYVEDKHDPSGRWKGYIYAGSMFVAAVIQSIFLHQYFHTMFTVGMRMRSAIIGLVYEKVSNRRKIRFIGMFPSLVSNTYIN